MIWTPTKQIDQQEETKPAAAKTNVLTGSLSLSKEKRTHEMTNLSRNHATIPTE
jgi:hypothetical protein